MYKNIKYTDEQIIVDKIKYILFDRLGFDLKAIKSSTSLRDDLGIDSFDALRIIFEVEDEFDIKVPPQDTAEIRTVKDIVDHVLRRINEQM